MRLWRGIYVAALSGLFLAVSLISCSEQIDKDLQIEKGWRLAVSIPPQAWLAKQIAGDRAKVLTLVPDGQNEHLYEPGTRELEELVKAKLILSMGMGFESQLAGKISEMNGRPKVLDVARTLRTIQTIDPHHHDGHKHGSEDPHIWLSPRRFASLGRKMTERMIEMDPSQAPVFLKNLKSVNRTLELLDRELARDLLALKGENLMTVHPSFSYLAKDYGFSVYSLEEGGKEPGSRRLGVLRTIAREKRIRGLLAQKAFNESMANEFAASLDIPVFFVDTMQEDYPSMMRDIRNKLLLAAKGSKP